MSDPKKVNGKPSIWIPPWRRGANPKQPASQGGDARVLASTTDIGIYSPKSVAAAVPRQEEPDDPIHAAAREGNWNRVLALIAEEVDLETLNKQDSRHPTGQTLLMLACNAQKVDVAEALLKAGVDPNGTDAGDCTALLIAVDQVNGPELVALLLDYGADPGLGNGAKVTPLKAVKDRPAAEGVQRMLEQALEGGSSLIWGVKARSIERVKRVMARGVDLGEKDESWKTAVMHARELGETEIARLLEQAEITLECAEIKEGIKKTLERDVGVCLYSMSYSSDGRLVSGSYRKDLRSYVASVIDLKSGKEVFLRKVNDTVWSVAYSPVQNLIAIASNYVVHVCEPIYSEEDGVVPDVLRLELPFYSKGRALAFSQDGKNLAIGAEDGTVRVVDIVSGREIFSEQRGKIVLSVTFSLDGQYLGVGSYDNTITAFDLREKKLVFTKDLESGVYSVAFSPDRKSIAAGTQDGYVHSISLESGQETFKSNIGNYVYLVAYSPKGHSLAAASSTQACLLGLASGQTFFRIDRDGTEIRTAAISPDWQHLGIGLLNGTLQIWE